MGKVKSKLKAVGSKSRAASHELRAAVDGELLISSEYARMKWSLETFTEATAQGSLEKAKEEIKEIEDDLQKGQPRAEEFVDAIMCLFDAAQRAGITVKKIVDTYAYKVGINKKRRWVKNPDNSYSHVKEVSNG